jgi:FAD:protein FMN transferase
VVEDPTGIATSWQRVDPAHSDLIEIGRVQPVMGTVVSLTAWAPAGNPTPTCAGVARALAWLHEVDDRFTTYRPSEWLRMADGSLPLVRTHPDIRHVLDRCRSLERLTGGDFSLNARPDRPLEPAAYVKGWATQRAADLLIEAGAVKVCVNCGGDVVVDGGDEPWRIGVQDPFDATKLRGVIEIPRGAVATSGLYARGDHLYDPRTGTPALSWASITVVGPDLGLADAYGTALFAAGPRPSPWFDRLTEYSAYLIGIDGEATDIRFALA